MRFENLSVSSRRTKLINSLDGTLKNGCYQLFGPGILLEALAGKCVFKGNLAFDQPYSFKEYRHATRSGRIRVFFLDEVREGEDDRHLNTILESYIRAFGQDHEQVMARFIALRNALSLPISNTFDSLSRGQQELFQLIIALSLRPQLIVGHSCFEGLSADSLKRVGRLLKDEELVFIFTSAADKTALLNAETLSIENGELRTVLPSEKNDDIRLSPPSKRKFNAPMPPLSSFLRLLFFFILIFSAVTAAFTLFTSSPKEELRRLEGELSIGQVVREEQATIVDEESYFEAPVHTFSVAGTTVELNYGRRIEKKRIHDFELHSMEAVMSSGLFALFTEKDSALSWLKELGYQLERLEPEVEPILYLGDQEIPAFTREHLDSRGNFYSRVDSKLEFFDEDGERIEPREDSYYLPAESNLDCHLLILNHIPFGGYYHPEDNLNRILLGAAVQKDFSRAPGDLYTSKYLASDLAVLPAAIGGDKLTRYRTATNLCRGFYLAYLAFVVIAPLGFALFALSGARKTTDLFLNHYRFISLPKKIIFSHALLNHLLALLLALSSAVLIASLALGVLALAIEAIAGLIALAVLLVFGHTSASKGRQTSVDR